MRCSGWGGEGGLSLNVPLIGSWGSQCVPLPTLLNPGEVQCFLMTDDVWRYVNDWIFIYLAETQAGESSRVFLFLTSTVTPLTTYIIRTFRICEVHSNFNGSNTFGAKQISSREGSSSH